MIKTVLFVGGGRRFELAKKFKERQYNIIGYESSYLVPLNDIADALYIGKQFDDPDCKSDLNEVIIYERPSIVLPLMDSAVPVVASLGYPVSSSPEGAKTCYNKYLFEVFMLDSDYKEYYPKVEYEEPYVMKPAFGFGSKGVRYYEHYELDTPPMHSVVQKHIQGIEHSVDAYFDAHAEFVDCVVRERTRTAGGEVVESVIKDNKFLKDVVKGVGESIPIVGPCNMQFIIDKNYKPWIIEVNARFGGGWTFSMEAGLDVISLIENDYLGGNNFYISNNINTNLVLKRSFRDHYFEDKK